MKWFKFYGQDYLSDPKMLSLSASERSCWITLLAYSSINDDGVVQFLSEEHLMIQAGISQIHEEWEQTKGILEKLEKLGMIRSDDEMITVINWKSRQEVNLTGYERTKRYRQNNYFKIKARNAVQKAIKAGELEKGGCEVCKSKNTEAHHDNYSKPLEVRWFCKKHHENMHHDDEMMTLDKNRIEENIYNTGGSSKELVKRNTGMRGIGDILNKK